MEAEERIHALEERIGRLVAERERLRAAGAGRAALESNRVRLAGSYRELSLALIARYLPPEERAA